MSGKFWGLAVLVGVVFWGEGAIASVARLETRDATREWRLALTPGRETGELTEESDTLDRDGNYFATHYFEGEAGEVVLIELTSEEFDTYLLLRDSVGNLIAEDDDGLGGTNSRIVVELPESGTYSVVANSSQANSIGSYEVSWETASQTELEFQQLYSSFRSYE